MSSHLSNKVVDISDSELQILASLDLLSPTPVGQHLAKSALGNIFNAPDELITNPLNWQDYVLGSNASPTFLEDVPGGSVYLYVFDSSPTSKTIYRFVPNPYAFTQDRFYSSYVSQNLSGLLATRSITI